MSLPSLQDVFLEGRRGCHVDDRKVLEKFFVDSFLLLLVVWLFERVFFLGKKNVLWSVGGYWSFNNDARLDSDPIVLVWDRETERKHRRVRELKFKGIKIYKIIRLHIYLLNCNMYEDRIAVYECMISYSNILWYIWSLMCTLQ